MVDTSGIQSGYLDQAERKAARGNPLGFALEFYENVALVSLREHRIANRLIIDKLSLEVPGVRFPFDVSGGAEQFRHHRCRLRSLAMSVDQDDLQAVLGQRFDPARYGLEEMRVVLDEDVGWLAGRFSVGSESAPFTARFTVDSWSGLSLRVCFWDVRFYGWLPVPSTALIAQFSRALAPLGAEAQGATSIIFRPVEDLVRWLLPSNGWKIPDFSGMRIDRISIDSGLMRVASFRFPDEIPPELGDSFGEAGGRSPDPRYLVFKEGAEVYGEAESALRNGQFDEARRLFLGKAGIEPMHQHAARRLLEIETLRPERFDELRDLVQDLLAKEDDFLPALFALAVVQEKRQDPKAGNTYERIGRIAAERAERQDAILAHLKAGSLLEKADIEAAVVNYERVLELDPDHLRAMQILTRLYEEMHHWYRALRMNLRLTHHLDEPTAVADCHFRMGRIFLERFDDLDKARKHLQAALVHDPAHLGALTTQAEVHRRRGQATRAVELLDKIVDLADPGEHEQLLLDARLTVAKLWEEELQEPESALLHYESIISAKPDHLHSLFKRGVIAAELEHWDKAAESFSRLLELEASGMALPADVQKAAALQLGRIYSQRPEGGAEARNFLSRAADLDESDLTILQELEQLDRREENWTGLVQVLENKAELLEDDVAKLGAILEAARISDRQLGQHEKSERLYRLALVVDPSSDEAIEGIRLQLGRQKRWSDLADILADVAASEPDRALSARRWAEIGQIRIEHLDEQEEGLQALKVSVQLDPGNLENVQKLLGLFREKEQYEEISSIIARLKPEEWNDDEYVDLVLERAKILHQKLDRREDALACYSHALEIDPDLLEVHRALADLYFDGKMWPEARQSIQKVMDLAGEGGLSAPGKTELHRKLAVIERETENPSAAVEQLRTVLTRYPEDREAAAELGQLLRAEERWEELAAFYAQQAERLEGEEAAALHTAAATIWWEKLKKLEPAATQYQMSVDAAPKSEAAAARLGSLQRVFASLGNWEDVIWVIRERISLAEPAEQVGLYMALASIVSSRLSDSAGAAECWQSVLELQPGYKPALLMLARHKYEEGGFEEAFELGAKALEEETGKSRLPADRRAAVALDAARAAWQLKRLDDAAGMYELHMNVYENRGYAGVEREAFERLELIYRKNNQHDDLALLYRRWLACPASEDRRGGLRRSLALLLFDHLDQPDEAIEVLSEQVLGHPDDQPAVQDLISMLRDSSRWERLAALLESQWDKAVRSEDQLRRLEELAEIYQFRLFEPEEAIAAWKKLLELDYDVAAERLSVIYRQEGMHGELADLLVKQAESVSEPVAALGLYSELGELAQSELHDEQLALDAFEKMYAVAPTPENQNRILGLLRGMDEPEMLGTFLLEAADNEESPDKRRSFLLEHAELCFSRLDRASDGLSSLRQAIEIEPEQSLVLRAKELYAEQSNWESAADMQELLVELADDDGAAARKMHGLGKLYAERLDAPQRAIAAFERAAELDGQWPDPLDDLAALFESQAEWGRLADLEQRRSNILTDRQEASAALHRAAMLAFDELDDPERGVELLSAAIAESAEPAVLQRQLVDRCEEAGWFDKAADVLEEILATGADSTETTQSPADLTRRIADLRLRADETEAAISAYEQALRYDPSDTATAQKLESLYTASGRHIDLALMLENLAGRKSGREASETWLAAARNWLDANDLNAAGLALEHALQAEPDNEEACVLNAQLLEKRQAWAELLDFMDSLPEAILSRPEIESIAHVCRREISSDPESAEQELNVVRMILRFDPDDLDALWRIAQLTAEDGEVPEAEEILRKLDERAEELDPAKRYDLDRRLAEIDFSRGRTEEAEKRLKRCVEAQPEDQRPRDFLHKIYSGGKRFAEKVDLLLDEAERADKDEDRLRLFTSAEEILEKDLGDPAGALEMCEKILQLRPDELETWKRRVELHRLLDDPGQQQLALIKIAELTEGEESKQATRKAARLAHDVLEDSAAARRIWSELLGGSPGDPEALDRLLELDREEDLPEELSEHLVERIEGTEDQADLSPLLRELAEVLMQRLDRPDEALPVMERLEGLHPTDREILEGLSDLYEKTGRWSELSRTLETRVELAGSEQGRAELLLDLAMVQLDSLADAGAAADSLRRAATIDPENTEILDRLRKVATELKDNELLIETLEGLAARTDEEAREHELRRSVGLLHFSRGSAAEARRAFTTALELNDDDPVSRRFMIGLLGDSAPAQAAKHIRWLLQHQEYLNPDDARRLKKRLVETLDDAEIDERVAALEDLLGSEPDNLEALRQLANLYAKAGRKEELARLLLGMIDLEPEEKQADLWMRRAEILLESGDTEVAVESLDRALAIEGSHRYHVAKELAKIHLKEIGDKEKAGEYLERALQSMPEDKEVCEKLSDLYWSTENWTKAEKFARRLKELSGEDQSPGLLVRLGDIQLRRGLLSEAQEAYREAIDLDPAYRVAYQRLEEVLKARKDDQQLSDFYLEWAKSEAAGSKRVTIYLTAAKHLERQGKIEQAISALKESLKIDPSLPEAYENLAPLLSRESRWEELLDILKQRRELAEEDERRIALAFEMGEVCKEHLEDPVQAAVHFEYCLQLDPDHVGALEELADIRYVRQHWEAAAELYQRLGDKGLSASRFMVAFRQGEIAEKTGEPETAIEHYKRSVELNRTFLPSRQNMVNLLQASGRWEEVPGAISDLLGVLAGEEFDDLVNEYKLHLADANRRLLRFDDAASVYREALENNPDSLPALKALGEYCANSQRFEEAAGLIRRQVELVSDDAEAARLWETLGDLYSLRLADPEGAGEAYEKAAQLAAGQSGPQWKLWRVLRAQGEQERLVELGGSLLETPLEGERLVEVHKVMGRALAAGGDKEEALVHFEQVLKQPEVELEIVEQTAELYRGIEHWSKYCSLAGQALEERIRQGMDPEDVLESYLKLAGVYQENLQDIGRAAACVRRALELHPRDPELLRRLGNLYASDWETYREAIEVFRELLGMDPTDSDLFRYLARLEAARGDVDRTAIYYAGLRFLQPVDQEARKFMSHAGSPQQPSRPLDRGEWDEIILHPAADCLLQRILSVLAPYLEKLFPVDRGWVESLGPVTPEKYPGLVEAAKKAAWLVSGREFALYHIKNDAYRGWVDCGEDGPLIVVSDAVLEKSNPGELAFFISRLVVSVAMGFVLPRKLRPADFEMLLSILCNMARPDAKPSRQLPATAPQYIEALQRITPKDVMEMVMPLIRRYALEPRAHDVKRWMLGVQQTADRVALLASGDLIAAMSVLVRFSDAAGGRELAFIPDRGSVLGRDRDMMALFRFAFSEQFLKLRRRLVPPRNGKEE